MLFWFLLFLLAITSFPSKSFQKRDKTDPPEGKRSNLVIYTDHETGIEYLTTVKGGLFPRITKENMQRMEEVAQSVSS